MVSWATDSVVVSTSWLPNNAYISDMSTTTFRDNGAVGALLDEYEKSIQELRFVIEGLSPAQLEEIIDPHTDDASCRSIQTILTHTVRAGYTYITEIRKWLGEDIDYMEKVTLHTTGEYMAALEKMFQANEQLFLDYPKMKLEEYDSEKKMTVRWGQSYDVEQLMEHAIVHILRHRRQIERFILKMTTAN